MLRVDRSSKSLTSLSQKSFPEAGWRERDDLQQMIRNSPSAFFDEMGEKLLLIGEEVRLADFVEDRIDLLAIDEEGNLVVIELKRGAHKLQLLQAIAYAAMIAKWDPSQILAERLKLTGASADDIESEIDNFLNESMQSLNQNQRIILMAEGFDYEVLVAAEWLSEQYEMDIRCYRLKLSAEGDVEYLSCTCIYPPPEISEQAIRRGRSRGTSVRAGLVRWADWDEALESVENEAVLAFFRKELDAGRSNYLTYRYLRFRVNGRHRFDTSAKKRHTYVWQHGRFPNDEKYWLERVGPDAKPTPVNHGAHLRFFLRKEVDFVRFLEAVNHDLTNVTWSSVSDENLPEDGLEDEQ